jgi:hypothetical protein
MVWGWIVVGKGSFLFVPESVVQLDVKQPSSRCWLAWLWQVRPLCRPERDCLVTYSSRDMQRTSDQWRSIFLGSYDVQAPRCSLRILGNRLVQSIGAGCSDYGNQARFALPVA